MSVNLPVLDASLTKRLSGAQGVFDLDIHFQSHSQSLMNLYGASGAGKTSSCVCWQD